MKTLKRTATSIFVIGCAALAPIHAQWQGTNPELLLGGTNGVIVGTGGTGASLLVRGDQVPVTDLLGIGLCTFRTDVASATAQSWRLMRDANDIGVPWHDDEHLALHVQSGMPRDDGQDRYSGVMVQNHESDGL